MWFEVKLIYNLIHRHKKKMNSSQGGKTGLQGKKHFRFVPF